MEFPKEGKLEVGETGPSIRQDKKEETIYLLRVRREEVTSIRGLSGAVRVCWISESAALVAVPRGEPVGYTTAGGLAVVLFPDGQALSLPSTIRLKEVK